MEIDWGRAVLGLVVAVPLVTFLVLTWRHRPRSLTRALPYLILVAAFAMTATSVDRHISRTRDHQRLAGPESAQQPLPEDLVRKARSAMSETDRWAPSIRSFPCDGREFEHYWLRYRLLPNPTACEDPDVVIVVEDDGAWRVSRP